MEIEIRSKGFDLVPRAQSYIERKLHKMNRRLPDITEVKVEIAEEKTKAPEHRYVVQVTINSSGILLRGEERGEDVFTAVDKVEEVLDRQIERYRGKMHNRGRGDSVARAGVEENVEEEEPARSVIKIKRFTIKPMSVDEAVDQMELLGHDFFLFSNADTGEPNMVYRRKDGNYGLIELEF